MRTTLCQSIPPTLEEVRLQFQQWRKQRTNGRARIPESLWSLAVEAAGEQGVYRTARTLGLHYTRLKNRIEDLPRLPRAKSREICRVDTPEKVVTPPKGGEVEFVELVAPSWGTGSECIVELQDPRGAKMHIQLTGTAAPDLAALTRSFLEVGR